MNHSKSEQLFQRAQAVIPGGVNSPVRAFRSVGGNPIFIARGEGSHIFDTDSNEYIDYVGSWGPLLLGHRHPEVIRAVEDALEIGTSFGAPTEREIELAEEIRAAGLGNPIAVIPNGIDSPPPAPETTESGVAERVVDLVPVAPALERIDPRRHEAEVAQYVDHVVTRPDPDHLQGDLLRERRRAGEARSDQLHRLSVSAMGCCPELPRKHPASAGLGAMRPRRTKIKYDL